MPNKIEKLNLKEGYLLIKPQQDSGAFKSEHKTYDRKSMGIIVKGNPSKLFKVLYKEGTVVVFDDARSIEVVASGLSYEVIKEEDILGIFEED